MKIGAIIQARMGSSRLYGKVLKQLHGKSVLHHVIERVQQSLYIDELIVATTNHRQDDPIELEAYNCGVQTFRGSEADVLSRYYYAAKAHDTNIIVRITADCPLIDPIVIDAVIRRYLQTNAELASNVGREPSQRTFPRGLDVEVFSFDMLTKAYRCADQTYQREHVTPYKYENSNQIFYYQHEKNESRHRWTLDTMADWQLITAIYDRLYHGQHRFYLRNVLQLFAKEPELFLINAHVEQKKE